MRGSIFDECGTPNAAGNPDLDSPRGEAAPTSRQTFADSEARLPTLPPSGAPTGIAEMSQVALLKRLRTSGKWLARIGSELCRTLRDEPRLPQGLRPRAIDSTTVQGPASKGTEWRVHYALDLITLTCDWYELRDAHGGELLERTPMRKGDVLLYLRPAAVRAVVTAGAHVLLRLRWTHSPM
ncbi:MAG TPA: hypothetical protein VMK12_12905, partial [Anaeromyxobacteraceae bacterium]|nr:hypothetical protein [Anaeromyxobacteraceae bacterium]